LKNRWKILFLCIVILPFITVIIQNADGKPLTYQQKVNQGIIVEPKYTMCLRKKMVAFKNGLACIYQGARNKPLKLNLQINKLVALANINVFIIPIVKNQTLMM
jgi:hypothetical protein